jgi:hypothetical protein
VLHSELVLVSQDSCCIYRAIRGEGAASTNGGGAHAAPYTPVSTGPCQGPTFKPKTLNPIHPSPLARVKELLN